MIEELRNKHKRLIRLAGLVLRSANKRTGDSLRLENTFIEGYYAVLRRGIDISKDTHEINQLLNNRPKKLEIVNMLMRFAETPKTYILINYYIYKFLESFRANTQGEYAYEVSGLFDNYSNKFPEINSVKFDYQNLISS